MLQSMGSRRPGHDLVTEQQQNCYYEVLFFYSSSREINSTSFLTPHDYQQKKKKIHCMLSEKHFGNHTTLYRCQDYNNDSSEPQKTQHHVACTGGGQGTLQTLKSISHWATVLNLQKKKKTLTVVHTRILSVTEFLLCGAPEAGGRLWLCFKALLLLFPLPPQAARTFICRKSKPYLWE